MMIDVEVKCQGTLPIYLPVPDGIPFSFTMGDVEVKNITFIKMDVQRQEDQGAGKNVDDGVGNYSRSRTIIRFITRATYDDSIGEIDIEEVHDKAIAIVNRFIDTCRFVTRDPKLKTIFTFPGEATYHIYRISKDDLFGELVASYSEVNPGPLASPFGIGLTQVSSHSELGRCAEILDEGSYLNPSWLLWLDAKRDAYFGNVKSCILNLAIALEIHIENLVEQYRNKLPPAINPDALDSRIYSLYDEELEILVGESLHSRPELFQALEYIRTLRNNIAHNWLEVFNSGELNKSYRSRYLNVHQAKNGHRVTEKAELFELVNQTEEILDFVDSLFTAKYP